MKKDKIFSCGPWWFSYGYGGGGGQNFYDFGGSSFKCIPFTLVTS